eukprot:TRINITY_DN7569_c0_g1_i4.p1 TRINITY_DN7569_c0_g1~~TRINITY_DN7569_c0_g1_i4.p1  ORF type:complete len:279 (+),score=50.00 TRINITY_DN7569_c0_g1_i4:721-1557(+)
MTERLRRTEVNLPHVLCGINAEYMGKINFSSSQSFGHMESNLFKLVNASSRFAERYLEGGVEVLMDAIGYPEYQEILMHMNEVTLADFGTDGTSVSRMLKPDQIVQMSLVDSEFLTIGLLMMPAGAVIPLHDHPGMTVTTKILCGEVERISCDLVDVKKQFEFHQEDMMDIEDDFASFNLVEGIFKSLNLLREGDIFQLTPLHNNIHSFSAISACVVLDVLTPNYDEKFRFCNFYNMKKGKEVDGRLAPGAKITLQYLTTPPMMDIVVVQSIEELSKL